MTKAIVLDLTPDDVMLVHESGREVKNQSSNSSEPFLERCEVPESRALIAAGEPRLGKSLL